MRDLTQPEAAEIVRTRMHTGKDAGNALFDEILLEFIEQRNILCVLTDDGQLAMSITESEIIEFKEIYSQRMDHQ